MTALREAMAHTMVPPMEKALLSELKSAIKPPLGGPNISPKNSKDVSNDANEAETDKSSVL